MKQLIKCTSLLLVITLLLTNFPHITQAETARQSASARYTFQTNAQKSHNPPVAPHTDESHASIRADAASRQATRQLSSNSGSSAAAPTVSPEKDFEYDIIDAISCSIRKYIGTDTDVVIPSSINGYAVQAIGDSAFFRRRDITSVIIPESVISIGERSFEWCSGLDDFTIPESVTSIRDRAFFGCDGLKSISIPESVTSIGNDAFSRCASLTSIFIPKSVTNIGYGTFDRCSGLTSILIPDSVTNIGNFAFRNCTNLTSITIPKGVSNIGDYAFADCTGLANISIPYGLSTIGDYAFSNCVSLASITIPKGVSSIGDYAFIGCSNLTSVTILEDVASIGNYAFSGCSGITSVKILEGVASIGEYAFSDCVGIKRLTIPGVANIGNYAFSGCYGLTEIAILEGVTGIGDFAFSDCENIKRITIPKSVSVIGKSAFSGCINLERVTLSEGLTSIEESAFYRCGKLSRVTFPESLINIGKYAFADCNKLLNISVPASVTNIGDYAFANCASLTSATLPQSLVSIGDYAFANCGSLTSATLPQSLVNIGAHAFSGCYKLSGVTIPENVISIGEGAFFDCYSLTSIIIPDGVTVIPYDTFANCSGLTSAVLPTNLKEIGACAFLGCYNLTGITIPKGVEIIGGGAFSECSSLTSITIPEGVVGIGAYAFSNCTGLLEAYIPFSAQYAFDNSFDSCSDTLIIYGRAGSRAEEIADMYGYTFIEHSSIDIHFNMNDSVTLHDTIIIKVSAPGYDEVQLLVDDIDCGIYPVYNSVEEISYTPETSGEKEIRFLGYLKGVAGDYSSVKPLKVTSLGSVSSHLAPKFIDMSKIHKLHTDLFVDWVHYYGTDEYYYRVELYDYVSEVCIASLQTKETECMLDGSLFSRPGYYAVVVYTMLRGYDPVSSYAFIEVVSEIEYDEWYYLSKLDYQVVDNKEVIIVDSVWDIKSANIPAYIEGLPVTVIGEDAFATCLDLQIVNIPDTVRVISYSAFESTSIESINIPYGVESILPRAFYNCAHLFYVTLPDTVRAIEYGTFGYCQTLFDIVLPGGLERIEAYAFTDCYLLSSLDIPASVRYIDENAFYNCERLVLRVVENSYAHNFVEENDIPYRLMDKSMSYHFIMDAEEPEYRYIERGESIQLSWYGESVYSETELPKDMYYEINFVDVKDPKKYYTVYAGTDENVTVDTTAFDEAMYRLEGKVVYNEDGITNCYTSFTPIAGSRIYDYKFGVFDSIISFLPYSEDSNSFNRMIADAEMMINSYSELSADTKHEVISAVNDPLFLIWSLLYGDVTDASQIDMVKGAYLADAIMYSLSNHNGEFFDLNIDDFKTIIKIMGVPIEVVNKLDSGIINAVGDAEQIAKYVDAQLKNKKLDFSALKDASDIALISKELYSAFRDYAVYTNVPQEELLRVIEILERQNNSGMINVAVELLKNYARGNVEIMTLLAAGYLEKYFTQEARSLIKKFFDANFIKLAAIAGAAPIMIGAKIGETIAVPLVEATLGVSKLQGKTYRLLWAYDAADDYLKTYSKIVSDFSEDPLTHYEAMVEASAMFCFLDSNVANALYEMWDVQQSTPAQKVINWFEGMSAGEVSLLKEDHDRTIRFFRDFLKFDCEAFYKEFLKDEGITEVKWVAFIN